MKKASSLLTKHSESLPPVQTSQFEDVFKALTDMNTSAPSIAKASAQAAAKGAELYTLAWTFKQVMCTIGDSKAAVKQFNQLCKALRLN